MRILFVCSGNTCRSPIAAAITKQLLGDAVTVDSAGLETSNGMLATREAVQVMAERGIDIASHRTRELSACQPERYDLIVAMTDDIAAELKQGIANATRLEALSIKDPYGKGVQAYRECVRSTEEALRRMFKEVYEIDCQNA